MNTQTARNPAPDQQEQPPAAVDFDNMRLRVELTTAEQEIQALEAPPDDKAAMAGRLPKLMEAIKDFQKECDRIRETFHPDRVASKIKDIEPEFVNKINAIGTIIFGEGVYSSAHLFERLAADQHRRDTSAAKQFAKDDVVRTIKFNVLWDSIRREPLPRINLRYVEACKSGQDEAFRLAMADDPMSRLDRKTIADGQMALFKRFDPKTYKKLKTAKKVEQIFGSLRRTALRSFGITID